MWSYIYLSTVLALYQINYFNLGQGRYLFKEGFQTMPINGFQHVIWS